LIPNEPVNLNRKYGHRYVVTVDEESVEGPRDRDPWLARIETRTGLIYPYSATHLGVQVDGHPRPVDSEGTTLEKGAA
jgi:hypothetical protein